MRYLPLLLLALLSFSCNKVEKKEYSVLQGQIEDNTVDFVLLKGTDFHKEIDIDELGAFLDTLNLKSNGFYELFIGQGRTEVYLEKGKDLNITFNPMQPFPFSYSGELANINDLLTEKGQWMQENIRYQELFLKDENDFVQTLDDYQSELDKLYASKDVSNKEFLSMLKNEDLYFRASMFENYENAHRFYANNPEYNASENFYAELKDFNYTDTLAFRKSATYQNLVETHFIRLATLDTPMGSDDFAVSFLNLVNDKFADGYAKDELMSGFLGVWMKPDEKMEEAFNIYKNSNPDPANFEEISARYEKFKTLMPGNPSPTFDYENYKGGTTSLSDLAGKYVYIDVWATWCGPCLREIPFLKEVESDYSGKNIQVVSISIDEPHAYEKWRDMIEQRSLGGLQLMADNNWRSQFVQDYGIQGIPRFILIDPEGKIVAADAPRPSDPELRTMLDKLL